MDDLLPIGTILFNTRKKKVGTIVGYYKSHIINWYDVDSDDDFYWIPNEVIEVSEKESLLYRIKYG